MNIVPFFCKRKEQEINDNLRDPDEYMYLLAELAFKAKFQMEKFLPNQKCDSQVQVETNELDTNENESFESTQKRMKLN